MDGKKKWLRALICLLFTIFLIPSFSHSRQVDLYEATVVAENFLKQVIHRYGGWGDAKEAYITDCKEFTDEGLLLGYFFPVKPRGYIMVNLLTQLPPIKAYSETSDLDITAEVGFTRLLKDTMKSTLDSLNREYGSLDALPETGIAPKANQEDWNYFLGITPPPKRERATVGPLLSTSWRLETLLKDYVPSLKGEEESFDYITTGPLLPTSWHQRSPYNNNCPTGDTSCTSCPEGYSPTFPSLVGCVATAASQIMKYWNYPYSGTGSHSYTWNGDQSCGHSGTSQTLSAYFSDNYDWENILNSYSGTYTDAQAQAVAELCYEVGVAFEMEYGVCGSSADTMRASVVFPTYFKYANTTLRKCRETNQGYFDCQVITGADNWFAEIRKEFDNYLPRLIQYRIPGHSIVCDGYQTGSPNMIHLNYGWNDSHTAWYAIDNLYGGNPNEERMVTGIQPKNRRYVMVKGATNNNLYFSYWNASGSFYGWYSGPGGSSTHAPAITVFRNKQYFAVKGATNNNIYINSKDYKGDYSGWVQTPGQTTVSPALVVYNNKLYLFVKGATNNNIYYKSTSDGATWSLWKIVPNGTTDDSPALAVLDGFLYLFVKGVSDNRIYFCYMNELENWSIWTYIDWFGKTSHSPAVVAYGQVGTSEGVKNTLRIVVKGLNNNLYWTFLRRDNSGQHSWSGMWTQIPGQTSTSPSLAVEPETDRLYLAVKGYTNNNIYYQYFDGGTWSGWSILTPGATGDTPVFNTFYFYNPF